MDRSNKNATPSRYKGRSQYGIVSRGQDSLHADKSPPDSEHSSRPSAQGIQGNLTQRQRNILDVLSSIPSALSFPFLLPLTSPFISTVTFSEHRLPEEEQQRGLGMGRGGRDGLNGQQRTSFSTETAQVSVLCLSSPTGTFNKLVQKTFKN